MAVLPAKKIATAGVLSAVAIVLGITRLGIIPWFSGASITIMHVPVVIAAVLEGPVVGLLVGLIFGAMYAYATIKGGALDRANAQRAASDTNGE